RLLRALDRITTVVRLLELIEKPDLLTLDVGVFYGEERRMLDRPMQSDGLASGDIAGLHLEIDVRCLEEGVKRKQQSGQHKQEWQPCGDPAHDGLNRRRDARRRLEV